jgi:hypothetical protein
MLTARVAQPVKVAMLTARVAQPVKVAMLMARGERRKPRNLDRLRHIFRGVQRTDFYD